MHMASDAQKYKAQILQIAGFGCLTPIGQLILRKLDIGHIDLNLNFFVILLISLFFALIGIICIVRGLIHLE